MTEPRNIKPAKRAMRPWTQAESEYLLTHAHLGGAQLAAHLGRSRQAINSRRSKLLMAQYRDERTREERQR